MSNEHNNPPVACGNGCDCLAQCGDTYAHAGLPKPSETEKAAPAPAVPQGEPVGVVYSFPSGDGNTAWGFKPNDSAWEVEKQPKSYERRFNVYLQATAPPQPAVPQGWKLVEMDDIKTGLNAALANVQAPAPTVPRGEAWGYVDHRGCAIKFKNARHRSELANAIECGGLEYLYTSPAEKLSNDIQSALESLVERCNHDAGMSNEDAVIHAEAVLEHVYNSRSITPAPSPAVPDGLQWFTVAEHGIPEVGAEVIGGLWYTDPWLKPEFATTFMWGQCRVVESKHRDFKGGKQWHTFGPSHNQITHWARINNPGQAATPAPAPAQEVPSDPNGWCEYVAGMVFGWLQMQEGLGLTSYDEDRFVEAIAGIVQRRLLAYKPAHPEPVTLTDEQKTWAVNQLMEQAQVFASAWSLVGGKFDFGNALEEADQAKTELRSMVVEALRAKGGKHGRSMD